MPVRNESRIMKEVKYQHRQRARTLSALLLAIILVVGFLALTTKTGPSLLPTLFILTGVQLIMASLNVRITRKWLDVRFGMGWPRFRFALERIVAVEAVRNAPWWGWGIRLTPRGWLLNVSGLDAVEIEFVDGNRVRIGTDDPQGLVAAIRDALSRPEIDALLPDEAMPETVTEPADTAGLSTDAGNPPAPGDAESAGRLSAEPEVETEASGPPDNVDKPSGTESHDTIPTESWSPSDATTEAGSGLSVAETQSGSREPQSDPTRSSHGDSSDASR